MPEISIIVPVYKAEQYLHSCVDSILCQTFSDFEVFLVDDGSPDNCGAICEDYVRRDSRVRVIHQENQGQSAARNHALEQARGQWICFVDSDDLIHPQTVEILYQAAKASGSGVSMCTMTQSHQLPEDFFRSREDGFEVIPMDDGHLCDLFDRGEYPAWVACAKLIRSDLIAVHPFCPGRVYEDNEAVCHWVCAAQQLARVPQDLYFYRTNPESTTQVAFSRKRLDYLWALEQIIRFYTSRQFAGMRQRFAQLYTQETVNCCSGTVCQLNDRALGQTTLRRCRKFLREQALELSPEQKEALIEIFHPKLMPLYWIGKGAAATLKEDGFSGAVRKMKKLMKGEMSE